MLVSILLETDELNPERAVEFLNIILKNTEPYPENIFTKLLFITSNDPELFTLDLSLNCLEYLMNFNVCVPQITKHLLHNTLTGINEFTLADISTFARIISKIENKETEITFPDSYLPCIKPVLEEILIERVKEVNIANKLVVDLSHVYSEE